MCHFPYPNYCIKFSVTAADKDITVWLLNFISDMTKKQTLLKMLNTTQRSLY